MFCCPSTPDYQCLPDFRPNHHTTISLNDRIHQHSLPPPIIILALLIFYWAIIALNNLITSTPHQSTPFHRPFLLLSIMAIFLPLFVIFWSVNESSKRPLCCFQYVRLALSHDIPGLLQDRISLWGLGDLLKNRVGHLCSIALTCLAISSLLCSPLPAVSHPLYSWLQLIILYITHLNPAEILPRWCQSFVFEVWFITGMWDVCKMGIYCETAVFCLLHQLQQFLLGSSSLEDARQELLQFDPVICGSLSLK